jgi:predicted DNA-binding transcriptional regulator AlpA
MTSKLHEPTLAEIDAEYRTQVVVPRFLDADTMADLMHVEKRSIYRLMRDDPSFPKPVHISERNPRWLASDYNTWVEAKQAQRDGVRKRGRR